MDLYQLFRNVWSRKNVLIAKHNDNSPLVQASQPIALVLSGGGARGFAHIGAIEELLEQGFCITSVAGTSMGALVGGMYAAGCLEDLKQWAFSLDATHIRQLADISIGLTHLVKGDRLMREFRRLVPDCKIENLPIPFTAVATNLTCGNAVRMNSGSIWQAIRTSISIPGFFKPVTQNGCTLVDGSVLDALPLDMVERTAGDLLVCVNVSAPDANKKSKSFVSPSDEGLLAYVREKLNVIGTRENIYAQALRMARLMIQRDTMLMEQLYHPDLALNIPMGRYGLFDFLKAREIVECGRLEMRKILAMRKQK